MPDALRLYSSPISPFSMRVVMQAHAKDLELTLLDPPGGLSSSDYCAIAPIGKVPVLELDGGRIAESEVICEYIEDIHPKPSLRPSDPLQRAHVRLLSRVIDTYIMNPMVPLFQNLDPGSRNFTIVGEAIKSIQQGLDWFDVHVAPGPYAAFERLTLADCAATPVIYLVDKVLPMFGAGGALQARKNVAAYWAEIQTNPHAQHALVGLRAALG